MLNRHECITTDRNAVLVHEDGFEVRHRNQTYGRFRVQWAIDLLAHELLYKREVVAAIGIQPAVYGDMDGLGLPMRVREIAILVFAATHETVKLGHSKARRAEIVENTLADHGLERFVVHTWQR